jgi:hypothetical protein
MQQLHQLLAILRLAHQERGELLKETRFVACSLVIHGDFEKTGLQ